MGKYLFGATLVFMAFAGVGRADSGFSAGIGMSTLGPTIEGSYRLGERFSLRGLIGAFEFDYSESADGGEFKGDLSSRGGGMLIDFYPTSTGFRITGGALYTDYRVNARSGGYEIGGITSNILLDIEQDRNVNPIAGIGWDFGRADRRIVFSTDVGAIFGSGFSLSATDPSGTFSQAQIDDEVSDIRKDLDDLKIIPFIKVGVVFHF
jgi:hypothetical protein